MGTRRGGQPQRPRDPAAGNVPRSLLGRLWRLAQHWHEERVSRRAAALSYYTLLSLIPLLVITDATLGAMFGHELIREEVDQQLAAFLGPQAARSVRAILSDVPAPEFTTWRTAASALLTFIAATGVFFELKDSLNGIWRVVPPERYTWSQLVRAYFAPMSMVLGFGFLLLVSLVLSTVVGMVTARVSRWAPELAAVLVVSDQVVTGLISVVLFGAILRVLPDVKLRWRDVWIGALVTAGLFMVGRMAIGLFLARTDFSARYGSAGAVVAIVVWVFYSSQILYTGAVLTRDRTLAERRTVKPEHGAHLEAKPSGGEVGETHSKA